MNRPTHTIASSWFNVEKMRFAWREALENWLSFLGDDGQIVIAINTSEDESSRLVREWAAAWKKQHPGLGPQIDILDIAIPYTDPAFDGKGKAAATAAATRDFVILLDCDERLVPGQRRRWDAAARELAASSAEALFVPVVDLMGDEQHYKSGGVATKWYLHKNLPHLTRGVVNFARQPDGSIETSRSDTCELINRGTGELAITAALIAPGLPDYLVVPQLEGGETPFVTHLGWLDMEQRLRQSAFWKDVWTARRGGKDPEPEQTLAALEQIPRFRHHLPSWRDR